VNVSGDRKLLVKMVKANGLVNKDFGAGESWDLFTLVYTVSSIAPFAITIIIS